jgi:hypothetical protein
MKYAGVDATIIKVDRHAHGATKDPKSGWSATLPNLVIGQAQQNGLKPTL